MRSSGRWTRRASRPRTSSATRSAATSRCSSPRAAGRGRSSRSRPAAAGRRVTSPTRRRSTSSRRCSEQVKAIAPHAEALLGSSEGKRRATLYTPSTTSTSPSSCSPTMTRGVAACEGVVPMTEYAKREGYRLDAEKIACPVRVVWGTEDKLLAVAVGRRALPRGVAPARRLGRARGRRPLPPARHPARDRAAHPRLHL